jgi:hypothetical protein
MGAAAIPTLYAFHRLVSGATGTGAPRVADGLSRAAAADELPRASPPRAPSPSPLDSARIARDAAALARRRAGAAGTHGGTLLTGGQGLVGEPVDTAPSLAGI